MVFLHGWGFLDSFSAEPECPLGNEQRHKQDLTPTLQGSEGGAAGRMSLPSTWQMSPPNQLCLCTAWPGSILAEQGVPKGEASCCSESWGEGAGLILLLGSYRNKCALPAPGSSQTWPRSCWLLQLWIESQTCALQAQFLCEVSYDSASCKFH